MERYKGSLGVAITGGLREDVTAWAGVSVLVELYRKAGVEAAVERSLPKKKSSKGLKQGQMVESFVLLSALGGDYLEDLERLRADGGLEALLRLPGAGGRDGQTVAGRVSRCRSDGSGAGAASLRSR